MKSEGMYENEFFQVGTTHCECETDVADEATASAYDVVDQ